MNIERPQHVDLKSRDNVLHWFKTLFESAWKQRDNRRAGITLGSVVPLYGPKIAAMETFCRLLWGVFPAISGGDDHAINIAEIFRVIAAGTDPENPLYWGDLTDFDQRCVEMTVFGSGLMLADTYFKAHLSALERRRMLTWLNQIRGVQLPKNNWSFFPIIIEAGLCLRGQAYSKKTIDAHFALLDSYYLGDGWYSDGKDRPRDYYNAMALHYYGLIYAKMMREHDPERCDTLRRRATLFASDFLHLFNADGGAIPFGRSLTYRFAQVAFWSAAAFAELDCFPMGVIKGLILRNLRWWTQREMLDSRGVMTVGYGYGNPMVAEDYTAPGSPYWACKAFLILALHEQHPFWRSQEAPLPARETIKILTHAGQVVHDDQINHHHYLLNAGQFPAKNYNNSESKYAKFAYSSLLGFNLERSRYGIELNACDSTLLFSEGDGFYRGRIRNQVTKTDRDGIFCRWLPWPDVDVRTWLMPLRSGHLRIHIIDSARYLESVEGGFPVPILASPENGFDAAEGRIVSNQTPLFSSIKDLSPGLARRAGLVISPPGSNILFPCSSGVPVLKHTLSPGRYIFASLVHAGSGVDKRQRIQPQISTDHEVVCIRFDNKKFTISL